MLFTETEISRRLSESYSLFRLQFPRGQQFLAALAVMFVLIGAYLVHLQRYHKNLPNLPWAGRRHEPFSKIRACFREYRSGWATLKEGQEKVCEPILINPGK